MRVTDTKEVLIFAFRRSPRTRGPLETCPAWSCTGLTSVGHFSPDSISPFLTGLSFFFFSFGPPCWAEKGPVCLLHSILINDSRNFKLADTLLSTTKPRSFTQSSRVAGVKEVSREADAYTRWSSCSLSR